MHPRLTFVSRDRETLHIVASDPVGGSVRVSNVRSKNILVWWDCVLIGPVPAAPSLERWTARRGRYMRKPSPLAFLNESGEEEYSGHPLAQRDRLLRRCSEWKEVALWFGPAAYEQMSLIQILAALSEQELGKTRASLVTCPQLSMSCYTPERIAPFFPLRTPLKKRQLQLSKRVWDLYCAPDPMPLFRFARRIAASSPNLSAALLLQLREYPSTHNGLSFLEEALLTKIGTGGTVSRAVVDVIGYETRDFGDQFLAELIWRSLTCRAPLLEPIRGSIQDLDSWPSFYKFEVKLTPAGQSVLKGCEDNIALNGIERWLGGVHLRGRKVKWRWNRRQQTLMKA